MHTDPPDWDDQGTRDDDGRYHGNECTLIEYEAGQPRCEDSVIRKYIGDFVHGLKDGEGSEEVYDDEDCMVYYQGQPDDETLWLFCMAVVVSLYHSSAYMNITLNCYLDRIDIYMDIYVSLSLLLMFRVI
jgi:hypothetical protein